MARMHEDKIQIYDVGLDEYRDITLNDVNAFEAGVECLGKIKRAFEEMRKRLGLAT